MAAGNGQYIIVMNSDLLATAGWLPPLLKTLRPPEVAVVGPRLVSPDGFLVGVGVVGTNEQPVIRGWGEPDRPDLYNEPTVPESLRCLPGRNGSSSRYWVFR